MMRNESEIFDDLYNLCSSDGYIYVIAYLCWRDNTISYSVADGLKADDFSDSYREERLIRTEISSIIGLMVKNQIKDIQPNSELMQEMIDKTDSLLSELHKSLTEPLRKSVAKQSKDEQTSNLDQISYFKEAIFYSAGSGYDFQFRDISKEKYKKDEKWLIDNKGFSLEHAIRIIKCIRVIHNNKLNDPKNQIPSKHPDEWEVLSAYKITIKKLSDETGIDENIVKNLLDSFSLPNESTNALFNHVTDFNEFNAYPIIKLNENEYVVFLLNSLQSALYETPFYWMKDDENYAEEMFKNRGDFTESFSHQLLINVFGQKRVTKNVFIVDKNNNVIGEIDVLVVYADRAVILQAKSKMLTINARAGDNDYLKDDFQKSIQDAYNQGFSCAELLLNTEYRLLYKGKTELKINREFKEIYLFCILSDFYPALSMQARQFLKYQETEIIRPPYILDVFTLDVLCEFLTSPIYFLSYINRRLKYYENILASNEIVILSYHLSYNLYLQEDIDLIQLHDDFGSSLDTAMLVRREGIPGNKTPEGVLTNLVNTPLMNILKKIENEENILVVELGFHILELSQDTIEQINHAIIQIRKLSASDGETHDVTVATKGDSGITIHCNNLPYQLALPYLQNHCEMRKYSTKSTKWYGMCISPYPDSQLRFAIFADYLWKKNDEMEQVVKAMPTSLKNIDLRKADFKQKRKKKKIGRNEPCPCGSGKKYKNCHQN